VIDHENDPGRNPKDINQLTDELELSSLRLSLALGKGKQNFVRKVKQPTPKLKNKIH
jgi:hypothetical protein